MERGEPTFRNFIAAFRNHWLEAMSGAFSVPFAVLAWRTDDVLQKTIFGAMAATAFIFASYRVWAFERQARNAAELRIAELESQYPHSLRLETVDYNCLF